ncbi:hypothetical protein [Aurantibacillus circumpalustris]|uniref:hypothetical protein n=1 Tax=Aurantibacillus circumpalustris TaxID=3036359 RepID=UPI00295B39CC|nr:hypothetical protein [Aurantibacillus circumpalustris]
MTNNLICKCCGNAHGIIGEVVCPVGFNKANLPMSHENKNEPPFALEVELSEKTKAFNREQERRVKELEKEYRMDEANQRLKEIIKSQKK